MIKAGKEDDEEVNWPGEGESKEKKQRDKIGEATGGLGE